MIRFFGQPKYALNDPKTLIGYEFLLREWHGDHWQVPSDFSQYLAADIVDLLDQTLAVLPKDLPLLSFNLDQAQFVDPAFEQALADLHLKRPVHLVVELTEHDDHVSIDALSDAASKYVASGLRVCVDDVGTGANTRALVEALAPYANEYKFALQNFRAVGTTKEALPLLKFWRDLATAQHKVFALEGVEDQNDLDIVAEYAPDVLQGYFYGKPALIDVA
ncbi:EAL domain-containing protein [Lacticaseibacillus manihotivorans]|uniref:C-di-GMP-specific phosphodiesterase n=2 Tax=Lacticaseibacillus manihotivorans TaxID=88233 RepID=A0A0R1QFW2_9LACO|nr:EAL domain-containing protein [Lacticaseibacillus manihotivorans]KRL39867.1 C-di-GMP-specific phosphodiesterase [Lacticaseibacillus manihotivorans DSM 13343 = JCM 12514]QFQ90427.1 EAL domain-containing protein [Lacticaseibacillus manihotivorans]